MIAANLEDEDLDDLEDEEQEEEMHQVRRSSGGGPGAPVVSWWSRSCYSDGFLSSAGG